MMNSVFIRRGAALLSLAAACSQAPAPEPAPDPAPEVVAETVSPVRIAPAEQPVAPGDCPEALRRAAAKPDLAVDRIPSPLVARPAPLQKPPKSAFRKDGSSEIKVDVLIDTLGKADLRTFTVVAASSPWLSTNIKSVIGKWTFSPALLAGCKVPRVYHFMASSPARATQTLTPLATCRSSSRSSPRLQVGITEPGGHLVLFAQPL